MCSKNTCMRICLISYVVIVCYFNKCASISIEVNFKGKGLPFKQFWRSTGLCPLGAPAPNETHNFLLSEDEKLNLQYIGALPNNSIRYVRIHWLLNLIYIRVANGELIYNFTYLDNLLDWIREQNLVPGFELMGLPQMDEGNELQEKSYDPYAYDFWYNITFAIGNRYIERYGVKYVKKWRFESWNEPDLKNYNILNFTLSHYLLYNKACIDSLEDVFEMKQVNRKPKFGGPAGLFKDFKKHPLCWGSLELCNFKRHDCPFQFISFHKKGNGSANAVLDNAIQLLNILYSKFSKIRGIPVSNDEADVLSNWSKSMDWRGDTRYAAMIAKIVIGYYKELVVKMKIPVELLSFDNGFLNYNPYFFTQRTLLARFQINTTDPTHLQFIRKPVYSVMGLLSLLGDEYVKENITSSDPFVQFLASRSIRNKNESQMISLLITYVNDEKEDKYVKGIRVNFNNLPNNDCKYVIYILDNKITNPFLMWKRNSSPVFPTTKLQNLMRDCEEPYRLEGPRSVLNVSLALQMNLTLPSVALINICSRSSQPPGRVTHLIAHNITRNEVLLVWKDAKIRSRCILTYEVEFRPYIKFESHKRMKFTRINHRDTIFLSYHHVVKGNSLTEGTRGWYRVRAVNYWNTPGRYSKVLLYSLN